MDEEGGGEEKLVMRFVAVACILETILKLENILFLFFSMPNEKGNVDTTETIKKIPPEKPASSSSREYTSQVPSVVGRFFGYHDYLQHHRFFFSSIFSNWAKIGPLKTLNSISEGTIFVHREERRAAPPKRGKHSRTTRNGV